MQEFPHITIQNNLFIGICYSKSSLEAQQLIQTCENHKWSEAFEPWATFSLEALESLFM